MARAIASFLRDYFARLKRGEMKRKFYPPSRRNEEVLSALAVSFCLMLLFFSGANWGR